MKLTKYVSTNILFLLGILLFILFIILISTAYVPYGKYNYGYYLLDHCSFYIPTIIGLLILTPIEMLFHKITHNKFILNIPFGNEGIKYIYNILFCLGITSSIFYLSVFFWGITRLTN